jgi:two-component system NtrC family sensor kinase
MAVDDSGGIVLANRAFAAMFGLNGDEAVGKNIEALPSLASLLPEVKAFQDSRFTDLKKELSYQFNGFNKTLLASFARTKEEGLFILDFVDISEERDKQEKLYLTDRLASVGEMASGIAHELNNPLTSVIGLSEVLATEEIPENVKEDVATIRSEARRAAVIVQNMLSFARKHAPRKQLSNINRIIEDVLKLRAYEHRVTGIRVEKELEAGLPETLVDYFQIQQAFINVVLNAEQAMAEKKGQGVLKITTRQAEGMIKVTITDNGPGIEPQNLKRIFDPFFTTKEVGKGTGLGLSICYGIISAHRGRIYAESEPGKGATFIVELPFQTNIAEELSYN